MCCTSIMDACLMEVGEEIVLYFNQTIILMQVE